MLRAGHSSSPQGPGRALAVGRAARPHPFRIIRRAPARCGLGRLPARSVEFRKADAVGARPNGDPRKRADPSAGGRTERDHPCGGARRARRAVGNGGGLKMPGSVLRHRRIVGRSRGARFHRNPAASGRFGAEPRPVLAGATRGNCEPQRCADALANRECFLARQPARRTSAGTAGMGCRAVPCARNAAGQVEHRP